MVDVLVAGGGAVPDEVVGVELLVVAVAGAAVAVEDAEPASGLLDALVADDAPALLSLVVDGEAASGLLDAPVAVAPVLLLLVVDGEAAHATSSAAHAMSTAEPASRPLSSSPEHS